MILIYTYQTPTHKLRLAMNYREDFAEWTDKQRLANWRLTWKSMKRDGIVPKNARWICFEYPSGHLAVVNNPSNR